MWAPLFPSLCLAPRGYHCLWILCLNFLTLLKQIFQIRSYKKIGFEVHKNRFIQYVIFCYLLFSHNFVRLMNVVAFGCTCFLSLWYNISLCEHASLSLLATDMLVVVSFFLLWMVVQWAFLWFSEGLILRIAVARY